MGWEEEIEKPILEGKMESAHEELLEGEIGPDEVTCSTVSWPTIFETADGEVQKREETLGETAQRAIV